MKVENAIAGEIEVQAEAWMSAQSINAREGAVGIVVSLADQRNSQDCPTDRPQPLDGDLNTDSLSASDASPVLA